MGEEIITHIEDIMAEEKKEEEGHSLTRFAVKITDMDEKLLNRVTLVYSPFLMDRPCRLCLRRIAKRQR